jgi:GTPase SAR1 family protein
VFDITQEETKENLQDWLVELEDRCNLEDVIIKVAANKFDIFEGRWFLELILSQFEKVVAEGGRDPEETKDKSDGNPRETGGDEGGQYRGVQYFGEDRTECV